MTTLLLPGLAGDLGILAVAALLGIAVLVIMLVSTGRQLWRVFVVLSALSPMPVPLPIQPSQAFALASAVTDPPATARHLRHTLPVLLAGIVVAILVAVVWSPDRTATLPPALTALATVAAVALAVRSAATTSLSELLHHTMWVIAPVALVQAVSTIVFRLDTAAEERYFASGLGELLLGDEVRLLFTTLPNNVTDPLKAGGILFVNGNKASMVMAVWALAYLAAWCRRRNLVFLPLATLLLVAAVCTGSKTALILVAAVPVVFLLLPLVLRARRSPVAFAVGVVALAGSVAVMVPLALGVSDLVVGVDEAAQDRDNLWSAARGYFRESPVLGLGYGGWQTEWALDASSYGMRDDLKPHNLLIWNWSNGGIVVPLLMLGVYLYVGVACLRLVARATTAREGHARSFELAAVVWMGAHAMYDNTELFGTSHTLPVFALVVARVILLGGAEEEAATTGQATTGQVTDEPEADRRVDDPGSTAGARRPVAPNGRGVR